MPGKCCALSESLLSVWSDVSSLAPHIQVAFFHAQLVHISGSISFHLFVRKFLSVRAEFLHLV